MAASYFSKHKCVRISDTPTPRKKTAGEEFKENVIFAVSMVIIFVVLERTFSLLFAPIKYLLKSDKERYEDKLAIARAKIYNRKRIREMQSLNPDSMLKQYVNRLQMNADKYVGDPDNQVYLDWYESLKNGTLIDSGLSWAPDVYITDPDYDHVMSCEFLDYLSNQVKLHLSNGSFKERHVFLQTIRNLYPEFTPTFSRILEEIEELRERVASKNLRQELISEITKKGISRDVALQIIEKNPTPEKLTEYISLAKRYAEKGYCAELTSYCLRTGNTVEPEYEVAVNSILDCLPVDELATALIKKSLTPEEVIKIGKSISSMSFSSDESKFSQTRYQVEQALSEKAMKGVQPCFR